MFNIKINSSPYKVNKDLSILAACRSVGVNVTGFCYHPLLPIAGNCRVCLVQLKNNPKPVASCAMPIAEGMEIFTESEMVLKARESALALLLKYHPLDCPTCDQGGECELQDQTMNYSDDRSRFYGIKRAVENTIVEPDDLGAIIKTTMSRCIHCTRCIRFAEDIGGIQFYGTTGRGDDTSVGSFITQHFNSTLSGNVVDICPVGALTHRPPSFSYRSWDLISHDLRDIFDMECTPITLQHVNGKLIRILPYYNTWISDRTRYAYEAFQYQRIMTPLINGQPASFDAAISYAQDLLKDNVKSWIGPLVDCTTLDLLNLNSNPLNQRLLPENCTDIIIDQLNLESLIPNNFIQISKGVRQGKYTLHFHGSLQDAKFLDNLSIPYHYIPKQTNLVNYINKLNKNNVHIYHNIGSPRIDGINYSAISHGPAHTYAHQHSHAFFSNKINNNITNLLIHYDNINIEGPSVYCGTHMNPGVEKATVILPCASPLEATYSYVDANFNKFTNVAVFNGELPPLYSIISSITKYTKNFINGNDYNIYINNFYDHTYVNGYSPTLQALKRIRSK